LPEKKKSSLQRSNVITFLSKMSSINPSVVFEAIMGMNVEQRRKLCEWLSEVPETAAPETAAPAAGGAEAAAEEKPKKARKAKTAKAEDALLAPVDALLAPVDAMPAAPVAYDSLRNHKYRLQHIDGGLCMGRKIDEDHPIEGTRKGDDGANGMFWPEKQCSKKPLPGQKLCKICADKDADVKAGKPAHKQWYGRLDEPIYHNAKVIGCKHFFDKYPNGLKNDPTTAPAGAAAPAIAPAIIEHVPAAAPAAENPKKKVTKAKTAPAPAVAAPSEAMADTSKPATEAEWKEFFLGGKPYVRNLKTDKVYKMDLNRSDSLEMSVLKDQCVGRWVDGAIDPTGVADEDEE
jgi:hypothetical protein